MANMALVLILVSLVRVELRREHLLPLACLRALPPQELV